MTLPVTQTSRLTTTPVAGFRVRSSSDRTADVGVTFIPTIRAFESVHFNGARTTGLTTLRSSTVTGMLALPVACVILHTVRHDNVLRVQHTTKGIEIPGILVDGPDK